MSRATRNIMRRALCFCRLQFLQTHPLSTVTSSRPFSIQYPPLPAPRTASYFHFRHFSDVQVHSQDQGSEKQSLTETVMFPNALIFKHRSVLMDKLPLCSSPSDVLDLTLQFAPTSVQLSRCLSQMWKSLKKLTEEQRRAELQLMWEHAAWEPLLQCAVDRVSHMPNVHLAYSLLALVKLGVSPRTRVVQTYLRAAQERINDFDDKSLSILSSCLENMEGGANVQALKHGIRLLVEARLPQIENVLHLQTMIRLVGKDAPLKLKHKLESKALSLSDQFTLPNAQYMITSMVALGFTSKPLLSICSSKIAEHLSMVPFNQLLTVLVSCRELRFRELQLLSAVSEYGASMVHVWTHRQLILVLSALESLSYRPEALLDSYSELVLSNPEALTLRDLLCVLKVCSSLNYSSSRLVLCLSAGLEQYVQRMRPLQLLKAQHHLSVLGHFSPTLLHALLQDTTLQALKAHDAKFVESQLDMLELCLHLERPDLHQALSVSSAFPHRCPAAVPALKPELSSALGKLMEDRPDWAVTEGVSALGLYLIDAVLTKKSVAEASVAVLCVPVSAFCFRTSHPRGPLALKLRHLRLLGYRPLVVPEQEILSLSEEQRVDFLRVRLFNDGLNTSTPEAALET